MCTVKESLLWVGVTRSSVEAEVHVLRPSELLQLAVVLEPVAGGGGQRSFGGVEKPAEKGVNFGVGLGGGQGTKHPEQDRRCDDNEGILSRQKGCTFKISIG